MPRTFFGRTFGNNTLGGSGSTSSDSSSSSATVYSSDTLTLDVSQNWKVWVNREAITFNRYSQYGDETQFEIANARGRMLTFKEQAASDARYINAGRVWLIPLELIDFRPKPRDVINDQFDERWTIQSVDLKTWKSIYRCICLNLAISEELNDIINIEVPTYSQDSAGATVAAWSVKYNHLRASVQPIAMTEMSERGVRGQRVTHEITVEKQIDPTTVGNIGRIVVVESEACPVGTILDIEGYRNPMRIDELPVIDGVLDA